MAVKKAQAKASVNGTVSDRDKTLELALAQIEKAFGRGAVMRLGESGALSKIKSIPTGSLALDLALGVGGLPRGRIIEIFGAESAGNTPRRSSVRSSSRTDGTCP